MDDERTGLGKAKAKLLLQANGSNELPPEDPPTVFQAIIQILQEPVFGLLVAASAIYAVIGEPSDAIVLLGFIAVSIGITLHQQRKSERALRALKNLANPTARVIRDSETICVPSREIVVGDLLLIDEGERVSADACLMNGNDLLVDESLLTGESVPVPKTNSEKLYSGTLVVRGSARAQVTATGIHTELGKIGKSLKLIEKSESPLQHDIRTLIKRFALFGLLVSSLVLLAFGLKQGEWLEGLLTAISLTMALLPEEFSVILTVFMALGVWRISRQNVLTRHAPVIETLGSVTTLCVDKTGTITQNQMSLEYLATLDNTIDLSTHSGPLPESFKQLMDTAVLASEFQAFDPIEKAYQKAIQALWPAHADTIKTWTLVHEYGLTPELPAVTHV